MHRFLTIIPGVLLLVSLVAGTPIKREETTKQVDFYLRQDDDKLSFYFTEPLSDVKCQKKCEVDPATLTGEVNAYEGDYGSHKCRLDTTVVLTDKGDAATTIAFWQREASPDQELAIITCTDSTDNEVKGSCKINQNEAKETIDVSSTGDTDTPDGCTKGGYPAKQWLTCKW